MDKRLLAIPVILLFGLALLFSGLMGGFTEDPTDDPVEPEMPSVGEPEFVMQKADPKPIAEPEPEVVEEAPAPAPTMGGMSSAPASAVPSTPAPAAADEGAGDEGTGDEGTGDEGAATATDVGVASVVERYELSYPISNDYGVGCGDVIVDVTVDGINVTVQIDGTSNYVNAGSKLKTIGLNTVGMSAANISSISGGNIGTADNFGEFGYFNTEIGISPNPATQSVIITFDGIVTLVPNSNGYNAAVHVISLDLPNAPSIKVTDGKCGGGTGQEIPEFPTIALPMLAIIGLAFFFNRRK